MSTESCEARLVWPGDRVLDTSGDEPEWAVVLDVIHSQGNVYLVVRYPASETRLTPTEGGMSFGPYATVEVDLGALA